MTLLDVGGYPWCWPKVDGGPRIILLNTHYLPELATGSSHQMVEGDGCNLQYPDGSFDIAYSNSVIEHLHSYQNQQRFAGELRRVGRRVWVQTPARCFFIDPHLLTPFVHYLPKRWQRPLLRHFTVWGWMTKPTPQQVEEFLAEVRLLNFREMQNLFPDCEIQRERFLGITKSYIAVR